MNPPHINKQQFPKVPAFIVHANMRHRTLGLGCRGQFNLAGQVIHTYPLLKAFPERMAWTTNFRNVHNKEIYKKRWPQRPSFRGCSPKKIPATAKVTGICMFSRQIIGKKIPLTKLFAQCSSNIHSNSNSSTYHWVVTDA